MGAEVLEANTEAAARPDSAAELLKRLDPAQVGAAVSKLLSAAIGDIAVVFSRSPQHKHYAFADLEWMILPAVVTGQYYAAEVQHTKHGARAPVAAVLWASVSADTDQRLSANPAARIHLRPEEWKSGDCLWIVDVAGASAAIGGALTELARGPFKDKTVKVAQRNADGTARIDTLDALIAAAKPAGQGAGA